MSRRKRRELLPHQAVHTTPPRPYQIIDERPIVAPKRLPTWVQRVKEVIKRMAN